MSELTLGYIMAMTYMVAILIVFPALGLPLTLVSLLMPIGVGVVIRVGFDFLDKHKAKREAR